MLGWLVLASGAGDISVSQTPGGRDRRRRLTRTVEPHKIRLFAKPDQLPPRVAAVLLRDERARRGLVAHAAQMLERLSIHEAAKRPDGLGNPACEQRPDFGQQSALELLVNPAGDALRNLRCRQPKSDGKHLEIGNRRPRL